MPEPSSTKSEDANSVREPAGEAERRLAPAARRALEEAAARRAAEERRQIRAAKEIGGRGGKDPARYGDWEVKGKAVDF